MAESLERARQIYKAEIDSSKPKYYVLDMFPYPSGASVCMSDILWVTSLLIFIMIQKIKRFNASSDGLWYLLVCRLNNIPIQTGQHPAITTEQNIARYREQLW